MIVKIASRAAIAIVAHQVKPHLCPEFGYRFRSAIKTVEFYSAFRYFPLQDICNGFGNTAMAIKLVDHDVLDHATFYPSLTGDLPQGRSLFRIQSPYIYPRRVERLEEYIRAAARRGVQTCVILQEFGPEPKSEDEKAKRAAKERAVNYLLALNADICFRPKIHEKIVTIDEHILYEGSLNTLSQSDTSERMNRWHSRDMVREATKKHHLDTCDHCIARRLSSDDLEHLRCTFIRQRETLGLTQLALSLISGVAQSTISDFEAGSNNIHLITLERLCWALHLVIRSLPEFMAPALDRQLESHTSMEKPIATLVSSSSIDWLRSTLKRRRQSFLLTQREFAEHAGTTAKAICLFESNKAGMELGKHFELCKGLDLTIRLIPSSLAFDIDKLMIEFWNSETETFNYQFEKVSNFMQSFRMSRFERQKNRLILDSDLSSEFQ